MTETPITAVPTTYDGIEFRSRLESEWAKTLDLNGIFWTYEPVEITLPSGTTYIPDFWLPDLGTWIEVKGPGIPRVEKAYELAQERACHCPANCTCPRSGGELVLIGREPLRDTGARRTRHGYANWETAHGASAYFTACASCNARQWVRISRSLPCRACGFLMDRRHSELRRAVDKRLRFAESTDGFESISWEDEA